MAARQRHAVLGGSLPGQLAAQGHQVPAGREQPGEHQQNQLKYLKLESLSVVSLTSGCPAASSVWT